MFDSNSNFNIANESLTPLAVPQVASVVGVFFFQRLNPPLLGGQRFPQPG